MNPRPNPRSKSTPSNHAHQGPTPAELLAKMPRRPMSPEQQAAALEKVQQQATQRVKLGQQLFEAAEARLKQHQNVLQEIQDQQQILREKVQEDVAKSLQTYDQWMGQIDESFTKAIRELNQRIDVLETRFDCSRGEMETMLGKAAALLTQTQGLLAEAFEDEPTGAAGQIATQMQDPVTADPSYDIEATEDLVMPPMIDEASLIDNDAEVIEVEIIDSDDATLMPESETMPIDQGTTAEADDVFGEVLRRLRSQDDDDNDGHAAA